MDRLGWERTEGTGLRRRGPEGASLAETAKRTASRHMKGAREGICRGKWQLLFGLSILA